MKWYADAAFAVHPDMKSHTGLNMTWGLGSPISASRRQKLNTKSSCEAELVAADEAVSPLMWTKLFLQEQGYNPTIMLQQDNTSAIKLEKNGKASSGKQTRHLHIRYFYIKDLLEKKEFNVEYCPTEDMQADFLSKPLQGEPFQKMFKWLMGIENEAQLQAQLSNRSVSAYRRTGDGQTNQRRATQAKPLEYQPKRLS